MRLSDIGIMTMEHSSGGNSTKALLTSEMENTIVRIQIGSHVGSAWRQELNIATTFGVHNTSIIWKWINLGMLTLITKYSLIEEVVTDTNPIHIKIITLALNNKQANTEASKMHGIINLLGNHL